LPSGGTYTLVVEGYVGNTTPVSYSFNAQKVTNTTAALTLGTQVNGAVDRRGLHAEENFTRAWRGVGRSPTATTSFPPWPIRKAAFIVLVLSFLSQQPAQGWPDG